MTKLKHVLKRTLIGTHTILYINAILAFTFYLFIGPAVIARATDDFTFLLLYVPNVLVLGYIVGDLK